MEQTTPKHHMKQEICATRPAYREGRIPKAVKVYCVNNESKYILIQGVPSVGAGKELIKLCSSYGEVEEQHALDEYPCEDAYTEVYLMKYKKIQSARFAKRKLDDYSFFGGNLHVCYAPEYETIAETREKLLDRRRIVASKIRRNKIEAQSKKATEQTKEFSKHDTQSSPSTSKTDEAPISHSPQSECFHFTPEFGITKVFPLSEKIPSSSAPSNNERDGSSLNISHSPYSFILPPPPKISSVNKYVETKSKYEYSRVPSKHSTLPANFDGRLSPPDHQKERSRLVSATQSTFPSSFHEINASKESLKIKKDYISHKQGLKFVPRQAVKRKSSQSGCDSYKNTSSPDEMDNKIRKNAFVLGDQQGPADMPGRKVKVPEITPGASKSYNDTIQTIRCKISQVITDSLKPNKQTRP